MKYLLIGDIHGAEIKYFEKAFDFEKPDVLICTGDFDQTRSIHQFKNLEKRYLKKGIEILKVPGNHDQAILNSFWINSKVLKLQGKTSFQLYQELMVDKTSREYIEKLVNSEFKGFTNNRIRIFLDPKQFGKHYQTIIMHGAYEGDLSSYPNCPKNLRDLWSRLITKEDYLKNFKTMKSKNYKIMIRGHDHQARYVYEDNLEGLVSILPEKDNSTFELLKNQIHTINPGALFEGHFATIDTKINNNGVPILKFLGL